MYSVVPKMMTSLPQLDPYSLNCGVQELAVFDGPHRLFTTSVSPTAPYAASQPEATDYLLPVPELDELFVPVIDGGIGD